VSLFVWLLPFDLSGLGAPAGSYATAGIVLGVTEALKLPHHIKVETPSGEFVICYGVKFLSLCGPVLCRCIRYVLRWIMVWTPSSEKRFVCSPKHPDQLWTLPTFLFRQYWSLVLHE